jgi:Ca-activated chloride channel family protein
VDVSGSMDALDLSTKTATGWNYKTRLENVKETFEQFVKQRPDDLLGLVTFGGYASTRVPLTADHDLLLHVLKGVDISRESNDQQETLTAIGDALATACGRLEGEKLKSKIVVLLSDGVSNAGVIKPDEATQAAKKLGFRVYTIGVGSTGRAPIWGRDIFGNRVIGQALVELDEPLLKKIAAETGGKYFNVKNPTGLQDAVSEIDKLERTEVNRDIFYNYNELFPWALIPGMSLIVLSIGFSMLVTRRIA